jgi:hypothetical protein
MQGPPPRPVRGTGHGAAGNHGARKRYGNGIEVFLAFSLLYAGKMFFENRAYRKSKAFFSTYFLTEASCILPDKLREYYG